MYNLTKEEIALFNSNYRQVISIKFNGLEESFELTEANILQGGLSINRYCISGDKIEIGSAISSELTLSIDNRNEKFNNVIFEGAELYVKVGIKKWDADEWENAKIHWIPLGYFTVDETPRKLNYVSIIALDRMVQFDKVVNLTEITFPLTVGELLNICCTKCNVPLETSLSSLPFSEYSISSISNSVDENLTYRQLIQWIAEMNGTCAYIDWNGHLCLEWYKDTGVVITPAERYTSDIFEDDITITGVQVKDENDKIYLGGNSGYVLNIENNKLIQDGKHETVALILGKKLQDFSYRPYSCTIKPAPYLYPLDIITFIDKKGVEHKTIVTHTTYTINSSTEIFGKGETSTKNAYASINPLNKAESIILDKIINNFNRELTDRETAVLQLNQVISNSLGLHRTIVKNSDDSDTYYFHDKETLEDSSIIYTFKSNGFAWTNDWNNGKPVWQYGFTRDGNVVFNTLSTYKITTEYLAVGSVTNEILATDVKDSIKTELTTLEQSFNVSLGQLSSEISSVKTSVENNSKSIESLDSKITQNTNQISLEVEARKQAISNVESNISSVETSLNSKITQTANQISLEVEAREQAISTVESSISSVEASLSLYVSKNDNNQVVSMLNASANEIVIKSNRLSITSSYFELTKDGKITATGGTIGGFTIGSTKLYNGISTIASTGINGVYIGTDGINLGGNFIVTKDGYANIKKGNFSIGETSGDNQYGTSIDVHGFKTILKAGDWSENSATLSCQKLEIYENYSSMFSKPYDENYLYIGIQGDVYGYGSPSYSSIRAYTHLMISVDNSMDVANASSTAYIDIETLSNKSYMTLYAMTTGKLYGTWVNNSGSAITSDKDLKYDIEKLENKYSLFFDMLKPIKYKYNDGTSGRFHTGFIAQDVEEAITKSGLTTNDFAGYLSIKEMNKDGEEISYLALRYSEFIALCVNEIQALKAKVNNLEKEVQNG